MRSTARSSTRSASPFQAAQHAMAGAAAWCDRGRKILRREAEALEATAAILDMRFAAAVQRILEMRGSLLVTGMGKAGLIGAKLAATFASTGTPSHFIHPAEAVHGDLGRFTEHDIVLALSNSGQTEEIVRILPSIRRQTAGLIAITGNRDSVLATAADEVLMLPGTGEACQHNLAPTTSTAAMLAYGDALALVISEHRQFTADQFAQFHPAGALGIQLLKVDEAMRPLSQCRVASEADTVREILVAKSLPGRRSGAVMLCDASGKLTGIFTDSDLARLLERRDDAQLDREVREVMSRGFTAITSGAKMGDAIDVLARRKISELPVVSAAGEPLGMVDVTDIIGLVSREKSDSGMTQDMNPRPEPPLPHTIRIYR